MILTLLNYIIYFNSFSVFLYILIVLILMLSLNIILLFLLLLHSLGLLVLGWIEVVMTNILSSQSQKKYFQHSPLNIFSISIFLSALLHIKEVVIYPSLFGVYTSKLKYLLYCLADLFWEISLIGLRFIILRFITSVNRVPLLMFESPVIQPYQSGFVAVECKNNLVFRCTHPTNSLASCVRPRYLHTEVHVTSF